MNQELFNLLSAISQNIKSEDDAFAALHTVLGAINRLMDRGQAEAAVRDNMWRDDRNGTANDLKRHAGMLALAFGFLRKSEDPFLQDQVVKLANIVVAVSLKAA